MAEWVECSTPHGSVIHVNLANVLTLTSIETARKKVTRIAFIGGREDDEVEVQETPEEILEAKKV